MNTQPIMYMFLRPTRSDRYPAQVTQMKPEHRLDDDAEQQEVARLPQHVVP